MSCGGIVDFTVCKGTTFRRVAMWQSQPFIYKPVTGVPLRAPLRLTVVGHGVLQDQLVAISDIEGMTDANIPEEPPALTDYRIVTVIDPNTIEFNDFNATPFDAYVPNTGIIRYLTLHDLTGFLARMDIRDVVGGTLLYGLSTTNGRITIDNVTKKITMVIIDEDSAAFTFSRGVYSLELESPAGEITTLLSGKMKFDEEVTLTETP